MSALRRTRDESENVSGSDALVIVAKYPEPGAVKTRLAALIGAEWAANLYRAFLGDLAERFSAAQCVDGYRLRWACAPGLRPPGALRRVVGNGGVISAQRGVDFAERLYHIACDMRLAGYRRLIIMSSDSPHLPTGVVSAAFAALDTADVALGPAEDGGYYLIGLTLDGCVGGPDAPPDLFRGIRMSTATVCTETVDRAHALGLSTALLAPTFDIDEAPDLARLWDALRHADERLAPRTRLALAALLPQIAPAALLPAYAGLTVPAFEDGRHVESEDSFGDLDSRR
ncbi:MAG TPA: TIGR04282 family arsenosugar biosynthesis glycosyltransferase [Ktedonobacterales bacterium]|jgi:rSAM/selenodomain-associated transferase 1|nr:TIGR04282 family arsenosugar biosynthesis glycosyltransferase [Ktedonobacterales bacterium]